MIKLYGVAGDPIAHSMSPKMHNYWFELYGIEACYHPFLIKEENLRDAVKGFKAFGMNGFNVTVPHKVAIIPLLDGIDPLAKAIGAVNTVVNENGKLIGYNTDGPGFIKSLEKEISDLEQRKTLIIGAGGAARAIYFSMAERGVGEIDIFNRTAEKAEQLKKECPFDVKTKILEKEEAEKLLAEYDLIIQTTSIGMSPRIDESPISIHNLRKDAFVCDIIYNPLKTKILQEAEEKGAGIKNGVDMFVYQGALAFEKWTGIFPETDKMKEIINKQLGG